MPGSTDEFLRQMVKRNLKLVSYHRGTKKLDHVELQTMDVGALNTRSSGFKGPATVPHDVFNQMLQFKLIEERVAESDVSRATYYLTETGRTRGLRD